MIDVTNSIEREVEEKMADEQKEAINTRDTRKNEFISEVRREYDSRLKDMERNIRVVIQSEIQRLEKKVTEYERELHTIKEENIALRTVLENFNNRVTEDQGKNTTRIQEVNNDNNVSEILELRNEDENLGESGSNKDMPKKT